jgi:hypothetical protein
MGYRNTLLATFGALLITVRAATAGELIVPNSFTPGTPARAAQINANFGAVATAVNDNAHRITTLETRAEAPDLAPSGNLVLAASSASAGNVVKDGYLFLHSYGTQSTFLGEGAGETVATTTTRDTGIGWGALKRLTSGYSNTAVGAQALYYNADGGNNTAIGASALEGNVSGYSSTAVGAYALRANTAGLDNVAVGSEALEANTTGTYNTAVGAEALSDNLTSYRNAAFGAFALRSNTAGSANTALGADALVNSTGDANTAVGEGALLGNTSGRDNIALGAGAGLQLTTGNGNIDIGNPGVTGEAMTIRIGSGQVRTFVAGIRGVTTVNSLPVVIDSAGQLGTVSSSRAVKDHIVDMDDASGVLARLRPVTFYYRSDQNPDGRTLQYGLVAEEVAEVAPGLVAHSADGAIETVYYQFLPPMLLNEWQKQQRTIAALEARVAELEQSLRGERQ